jgi:hypothetical protein
LIQNGFCCLNRHDLVLIKLDLVEVVSQQELASTSYTAPNATLYWRVVPGARLTDSVNAGVITLLQPWPALGVGKATSVRLLEVPAYPTIVAILYNS